MPVVVSFSIHAELAIIIWEQVCLGAEIELCKDALHPTQILPHHVLAAHLERLWEVIELLVLGGFFQMLWFGLTCPLYVPFRTVWPDNTHTSCLKRIDDRVIDMSCLRYFEAKHHVVLFEVFLPCDLDLLELAQVWLASPITCFEESCALLHSGRSVTILASSVRIRLLFFSFVAVFGVGEVNTRRRLWLA